MKDRIILVAVDLQKDFIDGALGTKEAQAVVPAAAARIRELRKAGAEVFATLDTHGEDYMQTQEGRKLPVPHCIRNTDGWQLDPVIREALGEFAAVEKPTFGSVRLPEMIRDRIGPEENVTIELLGLCTDICVVSNAMLLKAAFPETDFAVHADCCAGVTPDKHEAALETMRSCQITVI
jgi:nicotinamidase-related amidase